MNDIDRTPDIKRVLITGITGSAGRYLTGYLRERRPDVEIHGTCRRKLARVQPDGVALHEMDLLDFGSIVGCLRKSRPNVIFHFAANPDKGFEIPSAILANNAVGTTNLLEASRLTQDCMELRVFINVSSSEVYGAVQPEDVPIKESCPFRPQSPYAISKVAADHMGAMYRKAYGLPVITTRAFSYVNVYHPTLFTTNFARQIARIERGEQATLKHGNLDSVRTFVDTRDIMEAYWLAATKCRLGEAYNIGGTAAMSVRDVLDRMRYLSMTQVNREIPCEQDPALMRPADVTMQVPDCAKFINETGWQPHFDLDDSLRKLMDHWRKEVK